MTILERIALDIQNARFAKNKLEVVLLTTILGELQRSPKKITTDDAVIKALTTYIKGLNERVRFYVEESSRKRIYDEIDLIKERYLPRELEYEKLVDLVSSKIDEFSEVKELMQFLSKYQEETGLNVDRAAARTIFTDLKNI